MERISAEYIWIGGKDTHNDLRSKVRTLDLNITNDWSKLTFAELNKMYLHKIPEWNFDGSSTGQASSNDDTEVVLKPCAICPDPFSVSHRDMSSNGRGMSHNILVLCDCYTSDGKPHMTNTRFQAKHIFKQYEREIPWFGLEQEYVIFNKDNTKPIGWGILTPEPQGKYYCGNGHDKVFARKFIDKHYRYCLYSKLDISGYNAEVMSGQYEFQIGPVEGISAADQLIIARFILLRLSEQHEFYINYNPKPIKGNWNGSGLHHNFSTLHMREYGGYKYIEEAITKLSALHKEHLAVYGKDNHLRLTGKHETSSMDIFTSGIGTRNTSVRIPNETYRRQYGYFEDRRVGANADPYLTTSIIMETCGN